MPEFSGVAATSAFDEAARRRCGAPESWRSGAAESPIRPRPFGRRLTTVGRWISFRAFSLIVCLSDSAGGRDPLVAYAGMSRVNAGPYGAAQDARMDAIRGPADSHGDFAPRGAPVGGRLKRAMDIALATASLVLLAPMFLLIAVLLQVGLGRPVFIARQRVGFAGERFTAYAFSTAPTDAASPLATCVVGLLRDSGLDRLPELISVLRGDMSFVGPRPIEACHPGPYRPDYLAARPGLIGVFQSRRSGRWGDRRCAAMDRYYARRWTIWLDLAALTRSIGDAS
jgi:exopolysaccharide production protein ExoY